MSLIATIQDFEPTANQQTSALYSSGYRQYPFFQDRVDALKGRVAPNNQKLAIWGCGWGYLVSLCVAAGYDAFGFDSSSYAINKGKTILPAISSRLFLRDALSTADVSASKSDAGIHGATNFSLLVTEDLLPCMSDSEIATTLPLLRSISQSNVLHMISVLLPGYSQDQRVNWKSGSDWKSLLSPPDVVMNAYDLTVL